VGRGATVDAGLDGGFPFGVGFEVGLGAGVANAVEDGAIVAPWLASIGPDGLPGASRLGPAATTGPGGPVATARSPNVPPPRTATRATTISVRMASRRVEAEIRGTVVRTILRGPRGYHQVVTPDPASTGAAQLMRSVGLMVDGPGQWGRPVTAPGPGIFAIELAAPLPSAPIDLSKVGKWIERVETLRLDGARPTSKVLAARLTAFWLPSQTVLYIGASEASIGRRVAAMTRTQLGDRRPYSGGHWLMALRNLEGLRVWWAPTDATEEYEDALLEAFAERVPAAERSALADRDVVLPFANLRRGDGQRKATGLTGSLLAEVVEAPPPPARIVQLPDGDAEGARGEPPEPRRRAAPAKRAAPASPSSGSPPPERAGPAEAPDVGIGALTADGAGRLQAELDHLTRVRRPEVIARIRTAKEHGDLKENAEYHAAREEQSFLEGRVQALEARLRTAVVMDAPVAGARVGFGSRVTVEADGETVAYTIVGASDSDPAAGRISSASPVGRALVGHDVGDTVAVKTPAGERHYRILEVG